MTPTPREAGKSPHTVALALDDNMVYAFFVLVHSLVKTCTRPFALVVGYFSGKLSRNHQRLISQFVEGLGIECEIRELTPNPLFTERRHLTITTFSKFVISDAFSDPHLWIDLDTVARAGWDEFFEHLYSAPKSAALVVAKKLESPHTRFEGFNAGVLGWTSAARAPWTEALQSLPEKRFSSEQYLFNTLYADSTNQVDVKFNFLSSWHEQSEELSRAAIIHYSGPIKPWHLARRHGPAWRSINASWQAWFDAELSLLEDFLGTNVGRDLVKLKRQALMSGRLHTGKGALAGWVMKALAVIGPLGDPLVWVLRQRARL